MTNSSVSFKEAIVPLLKKIKEKPQVEYEFLFKDYPVDKQREFSRFLAEYVGFIPDKGVIAESEHPFTNSLHNKDVRITNHYYENNLESAIFSIIHEAGHGIYEMNIPDELTQTIVGEGSSMGLHESQSRFCENIIGRSKAFWEPIYGKLVSTFPEQLKDVDLDKFITAINRTEPGLIRTEADELTYSLHVLVRYEVEKKIFNEDYPVEKLPELWNVYTKNTLAYALTHIRTASSRMYTGQVEASATSPATPLAMQSVQSFITR